MHPLCRNRHRWMEVLLLCLLMTTVALPTLAAPPNAADLSSVPGGFGVSGIQTSRNRAAAVPVTTIPTAKIPTAKVRAAIVRAAIVRAIYLPPASMTERRIADLIHYAEQVPVNGVVLHVKDPFGRLSWQSATPLASANVDVNVNGSRRQTRHLINLVERLQAKGIWTIAKLDLFADHGLVAGNPAMGLIHKETLENWQDKNGLNWANPYDERVWDYYITLATELAGLGFDEVQFDYVRFPSDGDLSNIAYPLKQPGVTRAACIGRFLAKAYAQLKPTGVTISADIFGLTAWKRDDFGVGQILEEMTPHLDVVCPMFYPSHFPRGFLGKKTPGDYPREIMARSMANILRRTDKIVRPWVQGFWYKSEEVAAQLEGIEAEAEPTWAVSTLAA